MKQFLGQVEISGKQQFTCGNYYPFGMRLGGQSYTNPLQAAANKYLYNSKELQDDLGLDWYDYGARFYDAQIGRWHVVDAYSEFIPELTPYSYVGNNPITYLDPDGNFRSKFGAWWHKLWNGGDAVMQHEDGEYFVYTDNSEGFSTASRVFDKKGRTHSKNLKLEAQVDAYLTQMNFKDSWEKMGGTVYYTDNKWEARSSMLKPVADVVMPAPIKSITLSTITNKLPKQLHHFATNKNKFYTPQMEEIAKQFGLILDGVWNKKLLRHLGRHPNKYHDFVLSGMQRAAAESGGSVTKFLKLYNKYVKKPIIKNPKLLRKSGWE